ncbi:MAG TPA: diguanylate cyclase [Acidothermaceae bacterium]
MSYAARGISYLVIAVTVVTAVLLAAFTVQRREALTAGTNSDSAVLALTAMLDQETGVRGFLYTGDPVFLEPYLAGQADYAMQRLLVVKAARGDATSTRLAALEDSSANTWQQWATAVVAGRSASAIPPGNAVQEEVFGKQQMDDFRASNTALRTSLDRRRDALLRKTGFVSTGIVIGLGAIFVLLGYLALRRASRRTIAQGAAEVAYRSRQAGFSDLIQAVDTEDEAHDLLQRHLHRSIPGASITVLSRNNSDNRLAAVSALEPDSELAERLSSAEPRSCLAIRLGRHHEDGTARDELISCKICSHVDGIATCQPLLVSGKVIGTVLIGHKRALTDAELRGVTDTVAQAAPVLANLKTIAIAENRASTDALTGLPNRRAMNDTLKRMVAHSGRTAQPLAAIAFDLDRFKAINDRYGHEAGDAALSTVGECLREHLRDSDFAARIGGEEFLILAPDTDVEGARVLAEKLREALAREEVPQLLEAFTASFGIAVMPYHATSTEALLRRADRACYLAKERGRNRVEVATLEDAPARTV